MRIRKLIIGNFKNLRDFSVEFDEEWFTAVVVGQNGTGKSNILEALIIIFRDLDLGEPPAFTYTLHYTCRGQEIHVDADPHRSKNAVIIKVDDEDISYTQFKRQSRELYLPKYVFGYYSGPSNRMQSHFEKHQELFYRDLLRGEEKPLRPLLYARHVHSQFVLLAFFNEQDQQIKEFLSKYFRIEGLDSVLFVMRQPPWKSQQGDARFWNARGVVQDFLNKLYKLALAPIRLKQSVPTDFKSRNTLEHLYLYLKDTEVLRQLARNYDNPQELFKALESTYISQLISEVRIRVIVKNADGSLTFNELSEGEQQLLMVLGLLRFTKEEESLFLLDEPDTHLNPAWSMQYLDFLNEVVGDQQSSHIVMTTHDPLVIANLKRSQVRILRFDPNSDRILVEIPEYDPFKMGYPEILTSDIFGLRSIINPTILELLDEKRELATKEQPTPEDKDRLADLNQQLEDFDFTSTVRDPLYEPFVRAMAEIEREEKLQTPVLTKEQLEHRKQLAIDLLRQIKQEREEAL